MISLTLLSFLPLALSLQVNVLHRVDVVRRQYGTCQPPLSACVAGRDAVGPYAACAPVCCFYSSSYIGGCQADSYCLVKDASDYTCCANGVPSTACAAATACVNFGQPVPSDAIPCPQEAPVCTTDTNGAAGCVGGNTATITGAGSPAAAPSVPAGATTLLGEPNTLPGGGGGGGGGAGDDSTTETDAGVTNEGTPVDVPTGVDTETGPDATEATGVDATGTGTGDLGPGATEVLASQTGPALQATTLAGEPNTLPGGSSGVLTDVSGFSVVPVATPGGQSGGLSLLPGGVNGSFTASAPPAAFTGAAVMKGRVENAAFGVAVLAAVFAVLMG